jgi:hypothetical protein
MNGLAAALLVGHVPPPPPAFCRWAEGRMAEGKNWCGMLYPTGSTPRTAPPMAYLGPTKSCHFGDRTLRAEVKRCPMGANSATEPGAFLYADRKTIDRRCDTLKWMR